MNDISEGFQIKPGKKRINLGDLDPEDTSSFKGSKKEGLGKVKKTKEKVGRSTKSSGCIPRTQSV